MIRRPAVFLIFLALAFGAAAAESGSRSFSNAPHLRAGLAAIDPEDICPGLLAEAEERGDGRAILQHDSLAVDAAGRLVPPADLPRLGQRGRGLLLTPGDLASLCGEAGRD